MPLSEDEQRVLDEIERQLRIGEPRLAEAAPSRRLGDGRSLSAGSAGSPTVLLVLACVGGIASMIAGVLAGGALGVIVAWIGFVAVVVGGVGLVRGSQAAIAEQVHLFAERYSGPTR